jgi:O-antigen/teichoic acid export membrane protein
MDPSPEQRRIVGVVIFMAIFIGAALILQAWDAYQAEGWSGLSPLIWAVMFGSVAGFAVEVLDGALERRGRIASTVFRVFLGVIGLLLALVGIGFVWTDSDASFTFASPILAGVGLSRLIVWMWHRRSRTRPPVPVATDATWR